MRQCVQHNWFVPSAKAMLHMCEIKSLLFTAWLDAVLFFESVKNTTNMGRRKRTSTTQQSSEFSDFSESLKEYGFTIETMAELEKKGFDSTDTLHLLGDNQTEMKHFNFTVAQRLLLIKFIQSSVSTSTLVCTKDHQSKPGDSADEKAVNLADVLQTLKIPDPNDDQSRVSVG